MTRDGLTTPTKPDTGRVLQQCTVGDRALRRERDPRLGDQFGGRKPPAMLNTSGRSVRPGKSLIAEPRMLDSAADAVTTGADT